MKSSKLIPLACLIALAGCTRMCADSATYKTSQELRTSHTLNGQHVELKGYFKIGDHGTFVTGGTVAASLAASAWQATEDSMVSDVRVKFGKEPNSIYMPKEYKQSDIEVRDSTGKVIDTSKEIKIGGTVKYSNLEPLTEPTPPTGAMAAAQQLSYKTAKEEYEKKKAAGELNDYRYSIVDVTIDPL